LIFQKKNGKHKSQSLFFIHIRSFVFEFISQSKIPNLKKKKAQYELTQKGDIQKFKTGQKESLFLINDYRIERHFCNFGSSIWTHKEKTTRVGKNTELILLELLSQLKAAPFFDFLDRLLGTYIFLFIFFPKNFQFRILAFCSLLVDYWQNWGQIQKSKKNTKKEGILSYKTESISAMMVAAP
jgi:hypothetical protein